MPVLFLISVLLGQRSALTQTAWERPFELRQTFRRQWVRTTKCRFQEM